MRAAGQARAALLGRDYVIPDDVKSMARDALAHRLIVHPSARVRGIAADDLVREVAKDRTRGDRYLSTVGIVRGLLWLGSLPLMALAVWWGANQSRLPGTLDTYYGAQPLHAVLERTTWHVAQHARQLERLLELRGITPNPRLAPALLTGLPLPDDVWDAEVPLG